MTRSLESRHWPSLASFFRGYLHQDAGALHQSIESAFDQFWGDASPEEQGAFAAEWRALVARTRGRPWRKVEPLVLSLGAAWLPRGGSGFAALIRHINRHISEPGTRT